MPFWVYGVDATTGQPRDPIFIETRYEDEAREQAAEAGMTVREVEYVPPPKPPVDEMFAYPPKPVDEDTLTIRAGDLRCVKCGSNRVIPDAGIGGDRPLTLFVAANPKAVVFSGTRRAFVAARVCAACGAVEFYVPYRREAEDLYDAFLRQKDHRLDPDVPPEGPPDERIREA